MYIKKPAQNIAKSMGGQSGDPISQCWISYEGKNYNIVFVRYGKDVMVSIRE